MIWDKIRNWMKKNPQSIVGDGEETVTYEHLEKQINDIAQILKRLFTQRNKCAVLCERNMNTCRLIFACWQAGIVPIPMSLSYGNEHCKRILSLCDPDVVLSDLNAEELNMLHFVDHYSLAGVNMFSLKQNSCVEEELFDVATIMCTSGTMGVPKGIMLTHQNILLNMFDITEYFKLDNTDKILITRPLYHCSALTGELLVALYYGASIFFFDKKYAPFLIAETIKREKITIMCSTPTLLNHLARIIQMKKVKHNLSQLVISGEVLRKDIAENIRNTFTNVKIFNVYGLTELAPRVSYLPYELFAIKPESVGIPLKSTEIQIVDLSGGQKKVKTNKEGCLMVKSPSVMKGYYRNLSLTQRVLKDGWLNTGDIAYKDEEGHLYIKGRVDDMLIKGGMNIYPCEIESMLKTRKEIMDVYAYEQKARIVVEIVLNTEYKNLSEKEVLQKCAEVLPMHLIPDKLIVLEKISIGATGKRKHQFLLKKKE